jgi:hypothetical protein
MTTIPAALADLDTFSSDAVYALTAGDLSQTTGLHIPVDSGVAAAFLR